MLHVPFIPSCNMQHATHLQRASQITKMPSPTPLLSIIIPHWNGRHHLDDCLTSLRQQTYQNFEIIIVDNASEDGSQAYIRHQFPEVNLIELDQNYGFTGACNKGYTAATGDIIILLNNDTETSPSWLSEIVSAFGRHPQAGSVIGKIRLFHERDKLHTAGDYYRLDGRPGNRGVWQEDCGQYDQEERVFSGCGAAVAYRRTALEQTGFLDDDFYFSCEDVDLGWRLNLAGWQVIYIPTALIYHKVKASSSPISSYYDSRNRLYTLWKNYPSSLLKRHGRHILAAQWHTMREALTHWRGQAARATLRGQAAGLLGLFKMLPKRRTIQQTRQITDAELTTLLTPVDEQP